MGRPIAGELNLAEFGKLDVQCKVDGSVIWVSHEPLNPSWVKLSLEDEFEFDRHLVISPRASIYFAKQKFLRNEHKEKYVSD